MVRRLTLICAILFMVTSVSIAKNPSVGPREQKQWLVHVIPLPHEVSINSKVTIKPVDVKLGLYSDGYYQVLSGLKINDAIVSSGQFMIDSESSLRSAVKLFSSESAGKIEKEEMSDEEMKNMNKVSKEKKESYSETAEAHDHSTSIVHEGVIDIKAIDKNGDGKVFQDPMDWNVISDQEGRCPLCGMFLKEVTIEEAKMNLKMNGFEYK